MIDYDECPRCGAEVPIRVILGKSGTKEFDAKCLSCGTEYGGFIVEYPSDPPRIERRD